MDLETLPRRDGLWADIIRAKYLVGRDLFDGRVPTRGSQFWNFIQKIKWYFKLEAKHEVRNGRRTEFWLDWWTGRGPFMARFPRLFSCCTDTLISVFDARPWEGNPEVWGLEFRRQFGLALSSGTIYVERSQAGNQGLTMTRLPGHSTHSRTSRPNRSTLD
jgi:hypothetical protein